MAQAKSEQPKLKKISFTKLYEAFDYYIMYWLALLALTILAVDDVLQHLSVLQHVNNNAKYGISVVVVGIILSKLYRHKR